MLKVRVDYVYVERPVDGRPRVKAKMGHELILEKHEARLELQPKRRIWCELCRKYFPDWRSFNAWHELAKKEVAK